VLVGHGALYIPIRVCSLLDQSRKKSGLVGRQTGGGFNFQEYLLSNNVQMTAFIATVGILSAGILVALLSTDLGAELALAIIAII
jgi:hypothetical protein